jgi:hypothetical protein
VNALKPISAAIAAVVVLAVAPAASADLVFDGRWRSPGANGWDGVLQLKPGNRNKLRYVMEPGRRGRGYAADLRVGGNAASERIEFQKTNLFSAAEGKDHWWAWSFRIARDSAIPGIAFVTQINSKFNDAYCSVQRGGASNSLRMMNAVPGRPSDRWYWTITGGNGSCRITQIRIPGLRVVKNRWIDFSCRFRWSSTPSGLSKCFYRVQPHRAWKRAFEDVGPNLVRSPAFDGNLRISQGVYKAEARPYVHLILGGLVVADTRAEAELAAFGRGTPAAATTRASRRRTPTSQAILVVAAAGVAAALLGWVLRRRPQAHRLRSPSSRAH